MCGGDVKGEGEVRHQARSPAPYAAAVSVGLGTLRLDCPRGSGTLLVQLTDRLVGRYVG